MPPSNAPVPPEDHPSGTDQNTDPRAPAKAPKVKAKGTRVLRSDGAIPLDPEVCQAVVASERWTSRITVVPDGCWVTSYRQVGEGHTSVRLSGRSVYAHRVALVAHLGRDIALGHEIDHECHTVALREGRCAGGRCLHRRCVNPLHLREVLPVVNTMEGGSFSALNAAKVTCPKCGHLLTPDPSHPGGRYCRPCDMAHSAALNALRRRAHEGLGIRQRDLRTLLGAAGATLHAVLGLLDVGISRTRVLAVAELAYARGGKPAAVQAVVSLAERVRDRGAAA